MMVNANTAADPRKTGGAHRPDLWQTINERCPASMTR